MPQPQEIELKLEVPAARAGSLKRLSLLNGIKPEKAKTLRSVYFDTKKQKLRKNGLSLRVRSGDGRHVQTVKKQDGDSVGLFDRAEWEVNVGGDRPDLDAARDTALGPLLSKKLRRKLKPVFETRVRRQVYPIHRGGSDIELTVDNGKVAAAGRSLPLCEIELELKAGKPEELFKLARAIADKLPVQLASKSKSAQGYDLIGRQWPRPVKAAPVALAPDMPWAQAFAAIARSCLHQIASNVAALRRGDFEAVHQMRIGLRRLRAAISLFAEMLAGTETDRMKSEFRWLTGELGPARELDVFVKRAVKDAKADAGNGPGMKTIAADVGKRRAAAAQRAKSAVESARFRRLMLDAAAWIEIGDWMHNRDEAARGLRERPASKAAAEELRRRRKKIRKAGARLAKLDSKKRHKLRIAAKKLRYATGFFAGVFTGKKAVRRREKFVVKLKKLQDALGDLNDIVVDQGLAKHAVRPRRGAQKHKRRAAKAFAAGRIAGREAGQFGSVMTDAERAFAGFAKATPFWS